MAATVIAMLCMAAGAAGSASQSGYSERRVVVRVQIPGGATESLAADLNGDRRTDVIVTRIDWPTTNTLPVGILLADGRGGYVDGTATMFDGPVPRTQHARQIVVAEFNGDGRPDIFIADTGMDAPPFPGFQDTLALSTPSGKLVDATRNLPSESAFTHSAAAADVDLDGDVDLYVGNYGGGDNTPPGLLVNDGRGRFTVSRGRLPPELETAVTPSARFTRSLFADVNGDGAADLILGADNSTTESLVLLNNRSGFFTRLPGALPPKPFGRDTITITLEAGDIDRDRDLDLVAGATKNDPFYEGRWLQILVNDGSGHFTDETAARLPQRDNFDTWPLATYLREINGDGSLDLAVQLPSGRGEPPPVYLSDGKGRFRAAPGLLRDALSFFVFVDSEGDGQLDVLSTATPAPGGLPETHYLNRAIAIPGRVQAVAASKGASAAVRISWARVRDAERYEVWRSRRGLTRSRLGTVAAPRFVDQRAALGVRYRYFVRAVNVAGKGPFSLGVVGFSSSPRQDSP